jgi:Flp pilus assembly protein TadD
MTWKLKSVQGSKGAWAMVVVRKWLRIATTQVGFRCVHLSSMEPMRLRNSIAHRAVVFVFVSGIFLVQPVQNYQAYAQSNSAGTLYGFVRDFAGRPVAGAEVSLQAKGARTLHAQTDAAGSYRFSDVSEGAYSLRAVKSQYTDASCESVVLAEGQSKSIDLIVGAAEPSKACQPQASSTSQPAFFDEPRFTVAGVTDTSNAGGHGSEVMVRNGEALARSTAELSAPGTSADSSTNTQERDLREKASREKVLREAVASYPHDFEANYKLGQALLDGEKAREAIVYLNRASHLRPGDYRSSYELALAYFETGDFEHAGDTLRALGKTSDRSRPQNAEIHHMLGAVDEKLGDPLNAVHEYEQAADLDPSEPNLFDWGTELLLHRAIEPAIEVFSKGNRLFPRSARMLTGLAASLYAQGSYDSAAQRICEASDLNPADPKPYLFMGKMQSVEAVQSDAVTKRLARFVQLEPENALANYYYAVSLWKRHASPDDEENWTQVKSLLEKATHLDPKLGVAYLQLGILYAERNNLSDAISQYQQAIDAAPQLEEAHYRLAQAYKLVGESAKAQTEMQLYTQISKGNAEASERERRELRQFVYELRDQEPASHSQ